MLERGGKLMRALLSDRAGDGTVTADVTEVDEARLPEGEVLVDVLWSTVNYKDGLCLSPRAGLLVKSWPHVGGIDFAGHVAQSSDPRWRPGDPVILTGWRVGETRWGGYATRARVRGDWLVRPPAGMTLRQAMAVGTAGLTAMLAILELEAHGLAPGQGEVLVTGAAGGVGSIAVALLSRLGHQVAAVTGRPETEDYLRGLGAARIVPRAALAEPSPRPLESETWAGCIDAVGGAMLARVLGQMRYRAAVAAVGNAGGNAVPASIIPFLLRGVKLLGIDSAMCPIPERERAWARIARDLPAELLEAMIRPARLAEVPALAAEILAGRVRGRVVVDVTA
jgi:acrylyl-CoA reductase (NADPH)